MCHTTFAQQINDLILAFSMSKFDFIGHNRPQRSLILFRLFDLKVICKEFKTL